MTPAGRVAIAVGVVVADVLLFAVPLTGLLAAWVVLTRPAWFRQLVDRLYAP